LKGSAHGPPPSAQPFGASFQTALRPFFPPASGLACLAPAAIQTDALQPSKMELRSQHQERAQFIQVKGHANKLSRMHNRFIGRISKNHRESFGRAVMNAGPIDLLTGRREISAVILDYGEVLCSPPSPDAIAGMAGVLGIDAQNFLAIYRSSRNPYDRGDLTAHAYWVEFARRANVPIGHQDIRKLRRLDVAMWSNVTEEMTEWLARVHSGGFRTAILSNMQTDMAAHTRNNFAWLRHIDHQVPSCA